MCQILSLFLLILMSGLPSAAIGQSCTLMDNFDGGVTPFWELSDPSVVTVNGGVLEIDFAGEPPLTHWALLSDCQYLNFETTFRCRDLDGTRGKVFGFRTSGPEQLGYGVNFLSAPINKVWLAKGTLGTRTILVEAPLPHLSGEWLDVRISAVGAVILVEVNGAPVLAYTDPSPVGAGTAMLTINAGGTQTAHSQWDDFVIDAFDAVEAVHPSWSAIKTRY